MCTGSVHFFFTPYHFNNKLCGPWSVVRGPLNRLYKNSLLRCHDTIISLQVPVLQA